MVGLRFIFNGPDYPYVGPMMDFQYHVLNQMVGAISIELRFEDM